MSEMIEVQIDSVRVHLMTPQRLVVLKQLDSERYLPIWVGPYEAEAIIVKLQNEIFYGSIVADLNGTEIHVDSRPSDAIALSVRAHVPILVDKSVMEEAGIIPEQDMPEGAEAGAEPEKSEPAPLSEEGTQRLSVFEDFLEKLDFDKPEDENDSDDESSDKPKKPKKK